MNRAYLITDSRYWLQAEAQLDANWVIIRAGEPPDGPKDWIDWLVVCICVLFRSWLNVDLVVCQERCSNCKIGIDARMLSHEKAMSLNSQLAPKNSKLAYPPQNLVDLLWKDKPSRSKETIYVQPNEFTGTCSRSRIRSSSSQATNRNGCCTETRRPPELDSFPASGCPLLLQGGSHAGAGSHRHAAELSAIHRYF
jgi:hypothetical protein